MVKSVSGTKSWETTFPPESIFKGVLLVNAPVATNALDKSISVSAKVNVLFPVILEPSMVVVKAVPPLILIFSEKTGLLPTAQVDWASKQGVLDIEDT